MKKLFALLTDAIAVFLSAYFLPGVFVDGFLTALIVALVLSLLNLFVRPVLSFFAFPLTLITLGLFRFVINALVILIAAALVPGFHVSGILTAILFGIVLSIVSSVIGMFVGKK